MSKCKGCGKEVLWGRTEDGNKIPLDQSAPCYLVLPGLDHEGLRPVKRAPCRT